MIVLIKGYIEMITSKKFWITIGTVILITLFVGSILLAHTARKPYYQFYGDKIPSINAAVGIREIYGYSTSTTNGLRYKSYRYRSAKTPEEDLSAYRDYLVEKGGFVDVSREYRTGDTYLRKASPTSEYYVVVRLQFDGKRYTIWIMREL